MGSRTENGIGRVIRRWVTALEVLLDSDGHAFPRERVIAYAFRHSYAQRHADNGTPVDVLAELMGHANMNTTQGDYTVRDVCKRKAVEGLAPLQIDCHGNQRTPVVEQLLASERLRQQIGQTAVPMGHCTEPSNVKAGGHSCPYRHQCFGCEHFRTDPVKPTRAARLPPQAAARPRTACWRRAGARGLGATRRDPERAGDHRRPRSGSPQRPADRAARSRRPRRGHPPRQSPARDRDPGPVPARDQPTPPDTQPTRHPLAQQQRQRAASGPGFSASSQTVAPPLPTDHLCWTASGKAGV
jgi:hypothetical protein